MNKISLQKPVNYQATFTSNLSRIIKETKRLETLEKGGVDIFELQQVAERINSRFKTIPSKTGNTAILNKYNRLQNRLAKFYLEKFSPRIESIKTKEEISLNKVQSLENTFSTLFENAQSLFNKTSKGR